MALIVEDDPHIAEVLQELVTSLGHEWIHAVTLEDVEAAIRAGGYCYVLLDMQIPANALSDESVGCGETALRLLRRAAPERNEHDEHVLPIMVVTAYSREHDFVTKVHKAGANDFIPKPFGPLHLLLEKIRAALKLAGREEHEACEAGELPAASAETHEQRTAPASVLITIDGTCLARRNAVIVNGARASLPDALFVILLRMVVALRRSPTEWESAAKLGMARNAWAPARIRAELKGVLPAGFQLVEANKAGGFRLNPAIVIERVEWAALGKHPLAEVRKVAVEGRGL